MGRAERTVRNATVAGLATVLLLAVAACAVEESGRDAAPADGASDEGAPLTPAAVDASFDAQAVDTPPRFEDYPPMEAYGGTAVAPDLSGRADDSARIADAAARGPNFAGHVVVVGVPCPQEPEACSTLLLVDANDGRVIDGPTVPAEVVYRRDSRLLVIDTPNAREGMSRCAGCTAAWMEWTGDGLELIPPETWVASPPPPPSERARIARIRAEESGAIAGRAPTVARPRWDRLLIRTGNGGRRTITDEIADGVVRAVHSYRGTTAGGAHVVEVERDGSSRWLLVDALTGDVTEQTERPGFVG